MARKHGWTGDMRDLPLDFAKAVYRTDYWAKAGCDYVEPIYPRLAYEIFDSAVNIGVSHPVKWLQRSLNAFNNIGTLYSDIDADGVFGPATVEALNGYFIVRQSGGESVLLAALNAQQGMFYLGLAEQRQKDEKFVYGWFKNRVV